MPVFAMAIWLTKRESEPYPKLAACSKTLGGDGLQFPGVDGLLDFLRTSDLLRGVTDE